jgi:cyclopropane-fatty-acyl-phospholipid synthase
MISHLIKAMETGTVPDSMIRFGIRQLSKKRITEIKTGSIEADEKNRQIYIENLRAMPLAVHTKNANEQHYELPSDFFFYALGKHLKYSSCFWDETTSNLDEAESKALDITIKRAELIDGHKILELGCGWGSLTLEMGKRFPTSEITAVSNSSTQKKFIESEAIKRNLTNIRVLTKDLSSVENFDFGHNSFDRVISVEMFEHFKNYEQLLLKISEVLSHEGKLFIHIFTHRHHSYPFEVEGEDNWMGKYFFTGGQMPAHDLLMSFQKNLYLEKTWIWDGTHYQKTSDAWLENMDKNKLSIMPLFQKAYGDNASIWFQRWRIFFMACAELFGYKNGQEWGVSHYLFNKNT